MAKRHRLALLDRALSRNELLELIRYEGFMSLLACNLPAAVLLEGEGLVSFNVHQGEIHLVYIGSMT